MSINVGYYDFTQWDWQEDTAKSGAIPQSGTNSWTPEIAGFMRAIIKPQANRFKARGNLQTLAVNKRVKNWAEWELETFLLNYEATSPAYDWWNIIRYGLYGGATGAPTTRPSSLMVGAKINRTTPEYWTLSDARIESMEIKGNMTDGPLTRLIKGIARIYSFNTTNYVQGTATRRSNPAQSPIIPASDVTIIIDNVDESTNIEDFTLKLERKYKNIGKAAAVSGSGTQIAVTGQNFQEFTPETFDGRLECTLNPYGTDTQRIIDLVNDADLLTCSVKIPDATNGKNIQFTASKTDTADQEHATEKAPSTISLSIDASTLNVATI